MKNKRNQQVKQYRKDIAELLRTGKQDYARIRVEAVIRENLTLQAYEILELYLELISVRAQLIAQTKEIPRDMVEAMSSIIYAASRVPDLPELANLRGLLASKYGKEYVAEASNDVHCTKWQVNENLRRCLTVEPPLPEEKLSMLSEIAQQHNVEWDLAAAARDLLLMTGHSGHHIAAATPAIPTPVPLPPVHSDTATMFSAPQHASAVHAPAQQEMQQAPPTPEVVSPSTGSTVSPAGSLPPQGWLTGPPPVPLVPPTVVQPSPPSVPLLPPGGYVVKSDEDIKKAYDAAPGPPAKLQPTAPSGVDQSSLPAVPPSAPPPPGHQVATGSADSEFDELQRRFEQLKKG